MVEGVTRQSDDKKVRYADAVDGGIGGKINRSIAIDGFRQNVRFNKNGRLVAINRILPGEELFTNYGPQFRLRFFANVVICSCFYVKKCVFFVLGFCRDSAGILGGFFEGPPKTPLRFW